MKGTKQLQQGVKESRKLGNDIIVISDSFFEKIALIMLVLWIFSPIAAMFLSNLSDEDGYFRMTYKLYYMSESWYIILLITGFIGCILGVMTFMKSIRNPDAGNIEWKQYFKTNLSPLFLVLMLYWIVLSYLTGARLHKYLVGGFFSREGIISYIAFFGIFCCGYIISNKKMVVGIIKFFTWIAVILSILMLINNETLNMLFCLTLGSAAFFNINHFGYFLCMAVMSSLYLFETEKKSLPRLFLRIAMFSIITTALVINTSLGPYLAAVVALIGSLIMAIWLDKKRIKRVLIGIILFAVLSVVLNLSSGYLFNDLRILGMDFTSIFAGEAMDTIGSSRWGLWKNAVRLTATYPIFGCGPARYGDLSIYYFSEEMRPHNEVLEYSSTIGIPGLMFYLLSLFFYLKDLIKKRKQASLLVIGLSCILAAYLASSLFGCIMFYTSPFFFMFLGLSMKMLKETPEVEEEETEAEMIEEIIEETNEEAKEEINKEIEDVISNVTDEITVQKALSK